MMIDPWRMRTCCTRPTVATALRTRWRRYDTGSCTKQKRAALLVGSGAPRLSSRMASGRARDGPWGITPPPVSPRAGASGWPGPRSAAPSLGGAGLVAQVHRKRAQARPYRLACADHVARRSRVMVSSRVLLMARHLCAARPRTADVGDIHKRDHVDTLSSCEGRCHDLCVIQRLCVSPSSSPRAPGCCCSRPIIGPREGRPRSAR
jgi:hypothetical protein